MTALNPMLTLVAIPCLRCGSTAETVNLDREVLGKPRAVCCSESLVCWFCGADALDPFWLGKRPFCCYGCAVEYAE